MKFTKLVVGRRFGEGIALYIDGEVVGVIRAENNRAGGGVRFIIEAETSTRIERVGGPNEPPLTPEK